MPDDKVKLDNKVIGKTEFSKVIDVVKKNSTSSKKSIELLADSFKKADKLAPSGNAHAGRIKDSILQASRISVMKGGDDGIKLELKNLEKSEKLLSKFGNSDADKKQAKLLKELIDQTKKGLKDSLRFHNKFIGSIKDNTTKRIAAALKSIPVLGSVSKISTGRIGDVLSDIPFLGPLFDFVKDVKSDATDKKTESDDSNATVQATGVDGSPHLIEIDKTTKETLMVAKKVAGIDYAQLKAIERMEPSEEEEREKVRLDNKTLDTLKKIAANQGTNGKNGSSSSSNGSDSGPGILSTLLTSLLGAGGATLLLAKFKRVGAFFSGFTKLIMKIPGVALIGKALSKILSFPVTFVMATVNGIWSGVDEYLKSGDIGKAANAALDGFADFFMAGFLKPVQDIVSNAIAKISDYVDPAISVVETATKWTTPQGLAKQAWDYATGTEPDATPVPVPVPKYTPLTPEAKAEALANTNNPVSTASMTPKKNARPNSAVNESGFMEQSKAMSDRLGIKHEDLLKIMNFESAGIDPSAVNEKSGASGLIQFMPNTATELGTSVEEIRKMSGTEQLPYVEKYLQGHGVKPGMGLSELYMSILAGNAKAAGKTSLWEKGSKAYEDNKGLDIDGNLEVSPQEATTMVERAWNRNGAAMFEPAPMETYEARDAAEMAYQTETNKTQVSVAPPVSMSTANNSVTNNNNTTSTVMMTPVRHQDSSIWKFNPVLV